MSLSDIFVFYSPIAQLRIDILLFIFLGLSVGLLPGIFGIGTSLTLIPILIFMGIPTTVVINTVNCIIVSSAFSGYLACAKKRRVDYKLGMLLASGAIIGAVLGVYILEILYIKGILDIAVSLLLIVLLLLVGCTTMRDVIITIMRKYKPASYKGHHLGGMSYIKFPLRINIKSAKHDISVFSPIILGVLSGVMIAVGGLGGNLVVIPSMLYIFGISELFVVGTGQFHMLFASLFSTLLHTATLNSLDLMLSIPLTVGVGMGVQIGAKISEKFKPDNFRIFLALLLLILCARMVTNLYIKPYNLYEVEQHQ